MSEDKYTYDNNKGDDASNIPVSEENNTSKECTILDESMNTEGALKETELLRESNINQEKGSDNKNQNQVEEQTEATEDKPEPPTQVENINATPDTAKPAVTLKKSKFNIFTLIRILCLIGFIIFTALFINEVIIQPIRIKNSIEFTRGLYNKPTEAPVVSITPALTSVAMTEAEPTPSPVVAATPTPDPNRDSMGRLLQFKDLLAVNDEVKGWITIDGTNIDYVVMQSGKDNPDYYLDKDIKGEYSKAGTLYIDSRSSIENHTQNLVIHGHNMVSTEEKMFHYLLQYKKLSYYKERPLINFDTIYDTGEWKIFSVFITPGKADNKDFFDYRKSTFTGASDFLNFVYQLRIRSILNIDTVDINENDQILMLSTCSTYELDNYRTVIVARKVRDGEDAKVDIDSVTKNENPLYSTEYFKHFGGEAPKVAATFEEALQNGQINWYTPPVENAAE